MTNVPTILVHPRCGRCQSTFCRRVRSDEPCSEYGAAAWVERHEPAFEMIQQRADGWYGVQDYENVHPGDRIEVLVAGDWHPGTVRNLDACGLYVSDVLGALDLEYQSFDSEHRLWRWPDPRSNKGWVGPFSSKEAAETVRYDATPGYLVCGVCGWDGWKSKLPVHYAECHGSAKDTAAWESPLLPMRRIS